MKDHSDEFWETLYKNGIIKKERGNMEKDLVQIVKCGFFKDILVARDTKGRVYIPTCFSECRYHDIEGINYRMTRIRQRECKWIRGEYYAD